MNWVFLDITFDLNQQKDDYANLISSGFTGINNDLTPKDDNALPYSLKLAEGDNNQPSNRNIVLFWYKTLHRVILEFQISSRRLSLAEIRNWHWKMILKV